jgi:hypothetical protein
MDLCKLEFFTHSSFLGVEVPDSRIFPLNRPSAQFSAGKVPERPAEKWWWGLNFDPSPAPPPSPSNTTTSKPCAHICG